MFISFYQKCNYDEEHKNELKDGEEKLFFKRTKSYLQFPDKIVEKNVHGRVRRNLR
jgi:hypothetical protein